MGIEVWSVCEVNPYEPWLNVLASKPIYYLSVVMFCAEPFFFKMVVLPFVFSVTCDTEFLAVVD